MKGWRHQWRNPIVGTHTVMKKLIAAVMLAIWLQ